MKSIVVGLTGNMGSGKSTVAGMIKNMVIPVFDADAAVHRLMRDNAEMCAVFARRFPDSVVKNKIDRRILAKKVAGGEINVRELERIIYPYLNQELDAFFRRHRREPVVVLEVPLLFEAGWDRVCNKIIVVSAASDILKQRVMQRQGMTEEKYAVLTERQTDDAEKRAKADYVIDTSASLEDVEKHITEVMEQIKCGKSF